MGCSFSFTGTGCASGDGAKGMWFAARRIGQRGRLIPMPESDQTMETSGSRNARTMGGASMEIGRSKSSGGDVQPYSSSGEEISTQKKGIGALNRHSSASSSRAFSQPQRADPDDGNDSVESGVTPAVGKRVPSEENRRPSRAASGMGIHPPWEDSHRRKTPTPN